jgi:hypothetical protein
LNDLRDRSPDLRRLERVDERSPRARYVAPFVGRVVLALAAWLPTRALDWLLARATGLTVARPRMASTSAA